MVGVPSNFKTCFIHVSERNQNSNKKQTPPPQVGQALLSPALEVLVTHLSLTQVYRIYYTLASFHLDRPLPQTLCCLAAIVSTGVLPALALALPSLPALAPPSKKHKETYSAALDQENTYSKENKTTNAGKKTSTLVTDRHKFLLFHYLNFL